MLCLLKTSSTYRGKGNSSCLILSVLSILSAYTFILLNTPTPYLKNLIYCLRILSYNLLTCSHYPSSYLLAFHLTSGYLGIHSPPFGGGARGRGKGEGLLGRVSEQWFFFLFYLTTLKFCFAQALVQRLKCHHSVRKGMKPAALITSRRSLRLANASREIRRRATRSFSLSI